MPMTIAFLLTSKIGFSAADSATGKMKSLCKSISLISLSMKWYFSSWDENDDNFQLVRNIFAFHISHLTISEFVLNEMLCRNASKFAIFLEYESPNRYFHFELVLWILIQWMPWFMSKYRPGYPQVIAAWSKVEMKNETNYFGFLYSKNMANFEVFVWSFSLSTNPEILRSDFLRCLGNMKEKIELLKKNLGWNKEHSFFIVRSPEKSPLLNWN